MTFLQKCATIYLLALVKVLWEEVDDMREINNDSFVFTALSDFRQIDDPKEQLTKALEYGIRIISNVGLERDDWDVVSGPFWRFRLRAASLLEGSDNNCSFFIRRVEATEGSNIKLYYYDLKSQTDSIIEIRRRPGLVLVFRSGRHAHSRLDVHSMCSREKKLCFLSNGDRFEVD